MERKETKEREGKDGERRKKLGLGDNLTYSYFCSPSSLLAKLLAKLYPEAALR